MNRKRMRGTPVTTVMTVERGDEEVDVLVEGFYWPGTPDVRHLPNGDPGYPGDPPEVDNIHAYAYRDKTRGEEVELTEEEVERAHEQLVDSTIRFGASNEYQD